MASGASRAPGPSPGQGRMQPAFPGSERLGSSSLLTPRAHGTALLSPGLLLAPTPSVLLIALYRYHKRVRWSRVCQPTGWHCPTPTQCSVNGESLPGKGGVGRSVQEFPHLHSCFPCHLPLLIVTLRRNISPSLRVELAGSWRHWARVRWTSRAHRRRGGLTLECLAPGAPATIPGGGQVCKIWVGLACLF